MTIDIETIRKLASEATPGPWRQWAGKGLPEAASVIMPVEMCIGVWWPLRAADETQDDKPLAWFRDPRDQAFASLAIEALPQLCDEADRLRSALQSILSALSPGSSWNEGKAAEVEGIARRAMALDATENAIREAEKEKSDG